MVLKSTFDSLVQRCQLAAGDPVSVSACGSTRVLMHLFSVKHDLFLFQQTKRKLDDAAKRLGHLYDKLREQSVRRDYHYATIKKDQLAQVKKTKCPNRFNLLGFLTVHLSR